MYMISYYLIFLYNLYLLVNLIITKFTIIKYMYTYIYIYIYVYMQIINRTCNILLIVR